MDRFLSAGRLVVDPGWRAPAHAHPFAELMVVFAGRLEVTVAGRDVVAGPGDLLCYAPTAVHVERVVGRARADFIFFAAEADCAAIPPLAHDVGGRMRILAGWLWEEQRAHRPGGSALQAAHCAALLAEARTLAQPAPPPLLAELRAWMRERLGEPLSVVQLARRAGMSRAHFIRTWRRLTGCTPMDELRRLRVEAARELVISTGMPLRAIAARTGFCDEYHLSRTFRRYVGVAPGRLRL